MRTPAFLQTRVERLERARDVSGIVAILSDRHERTYERAHAAKALADLAERLGEHRERAVGILLEVADEPTEVRRWALLALAELHEPAAMPAFRRAAQDGDWMIRIFAAHGFDRLRAYDSLTANQASVRPPHRPWRALGTVACGLSSSALRSRTPIRGSVRPHATH